MPIPLEDTFVDIVGKAQRGLGISDSQLAAKAGVSAEEIRNVRNGNVAEEILRRIAPILQLNANELVKLANGTWKVPEVEAVDGLACFNTPFDGMTVNAYLVWDPRSGRGAAFDTGTDCTEMMRTIEVNKIEVGNIFLTHSHSDHIAALDELRERTRAAVFAPSGEPVPGAQAIEEGQAFEVSELNIATRLTWGHSPGGMTFYVTGLTAPVAVVGDSLFAGSMGGGSVSFEAALRNNIEKILTLPDETIVCPGHGPLTSVGHEKKHNPFFVRS
jgi:glyoxylase-like metal-dependent hydrolase (beta-lactamase superfamily II)